MKGNETRVLVVKESLATSFLMIWETCLDEI